MGRVTTLEGPGRLGRGPRRPVVRDPLNSKVRELLGILGLVVAPGLLLVAFLVVVRGDEVGWVTWATMIGAALAALSVKAVDITIPRRRWVAFDRPLADDPPGALILPAWTARWRLGPPGWADDPVGRLTLDPEGTRLHHGVGRGSGARWLPGDTAVRWDQVLEATAVRGVGDGRGRRRWWRHPGVVVEWVDERGVEQRDAVVVMRWTGRDRLGLARELAALMNERAEQARPEAWGRWETGLLAVAPESADRSERGAP